MQRHRLAGVVALATAVAVTSAVGAQAAPTGSSVVDHTYSCRVRAQRYIDLDASVTLPPAQKRPRPATVNVFTVDKTIERNGLDFNVPQIFFQAVKKSLMIDRANCRRSSKRVPLKPTGLPPGAQIVTPTYLGSLDERCVTTKRVLLRLRITMEDGVPAVALIAIRNDSKARKPIAFVNWKPRRIKGYLGKSCVTNGTG
jgi:hypothetical protein